MNPSLHPSSNDEIDCFKSFDFSHNNRFDVGRGKDSHILALGTHISRHHCSFIWSPQTRSMHIIDFSTNGTSVNEIVLKNNESRLLEDGAIITLPPCSVDHVENILGGVRFRYTQPTQNDGSNAPEVIHGGFKTPKWESSASLDTIGAAMHQERVTTGDEVLGDEHPYELNGNSNGSDQNGGNGGWSEARSPPYQPRIREPQPLPNLPELRGPATTPPNPLPWSPMPPTLDALLNPLPQYHSGLRKRKRTADDETSGDAGGSGSPSRRRRLEAAADALVQTTDVPAQPLSRVHSSPLSSGGSYVSYGVHHNLRESPVETYPTSEEPVSRVPSTSSSLIGKRKRTTREQGTERDGVDEEVDEEVDELEETPPPRQRSRTDSYEGLYATPTQPAAVAESPSTTTQLQATPNPGASQSPVTNALEDQEQDIAVNPPQVPVLRRSKRIQRRMASYGS